MSDSDCLTCKNLKTRERPGKGVTIVFNPRIQMPGTPTIEGHRLAAEHMASRAVKFGVGEVMDDYQLEREQVLVACWWAGQWGPRRLKKILKKSKLGFGDQEELSRGTYYGFPLRLEADAAVVFETNALWRNRRSWETSEYPDVSGVLGSGTRAEIELLGSYFGYTIAHAQQTLRNVDENEGRETNYLYSLRVAHAIRQDPDAWMQRRRIVRTEEETKKYAAELWRTTTTIRLAMREDLWLQNDRACQMFNLKPCAYLPLCSGRDLVQSENWTTRKQPHPELDTVQISDLLSLTVSSARCFLQCPMKYWHKYIQRTEPAVSEEAVALSFGRAWHVCQEVYWKTLAVAKLAA
ncbi:hypothetical protein LCGC14_1436010 [marine sediment metagenome]|uniref:PD-(D/E)XK endonuclease-like domain-containing protein n=1 Tax=marine sediment metagenome TaxID=412755 RepID=A0A0F9JM75_9ZZZZ